MPRPLKTYVTSIGFFDLAVAAPSMKAALEAWGSDRNLFHQGFARESDDPKIVQATMAKPGIVLKRAVGSRDAYAEQAELPKSLPSERPKKRPAPKPKPPKASKKKPSATVISLSERREAKHAQAAFEKEQARREAEERKEDAAHAKDQARRAAAVAKAKAALENAEARHAGIVRDIDAGREALGRRAEREDARWDKERRKLESALRAARD